MAEVPLISFVIPAYNAADTIAATLESVRRGAPRLADGAVEAIVVDDGSDDGERLAEVVGRYPGTRLLVHDENRGMCAGRNSGIFASAGQVVGILDADDTLADDWPEQLGGLMSEWPDEARVCFSACRDTAGRPTVSPPGYSGPMTFDDALNERFPGEYMPLFRGDYMRARGFIDLGMVHPCGTLTYLGLLEEGPFWISARVLRIYDAGRPASHSSDWTEPGKARESARCYEALLARYGAAYARRAPRVHAGNLARYAVYKRLADEPGAWRAWARALRPRAPAAALAALAILVLGRGFAAWAIAAGKRLGLIKQYG